MDTPEINLNTKLFHVVTDAQKALAEWIVPNSGISDSEVLNKLLGILDDSALVKEMRESTESKPNMTHKLWPESPNCARTSYHEESKTLELEFKNGAIYQYFDVPKDMWDSLIEAPSIGSFMAINIKGNYRYCRV